jgi:dGTPase
LSPRDLAGLGLWELVRDSIDWHTEHLDELTRHRFIRRLIGLEVEDLVSATHGRIETAGIQSVEDLQRCDHNVIGWSSAMADHNRQLKRFLYQNMYRHYRVVRMQTKAENFLGDLFNGYVAEPAQLPPEVRARAEATGHLARAVCDYIAGMTDRYALDEHSKLFDPYTRP